MCSGESCRLLTPASISSFIEQKGGHLTPVHPPDYAPDILCLGDGYSTMFFLLFGEVLFTYPNV